MTDYAAAFTENFPSATVNTAFGPDDFFLSVFFTFQGVNVSPTAATISSAVIGPPFAVRIPALTYWRTLGQSFRMVFIGSGAAESPPNLLERCWNVNSINQQETQWNQCYAPIAQMDRAAVS
jgi:hypothetical protein